MKSRIHFKLENTKKKYVAALYQLKMGYAAIGIALKQIEVNE